jgi:hypothetical protein
VIALDADLIADSAGLRMRIDGRGNVLTCRLDGDAGNLFATLRRSRQFLAALRMAIPILVRIGIRLDVVIGTVRVGQAGSGVAQNAPARLLGLPAAHIG